MDGTILKYLQVAYKVLGNHCKGYQRSFGRYNQLLVTVLSSNEFLLLLYKQCPSYEKNLLLKYLQWLLQYLHQWKSLHEVVVWKVCIPFFYRSGICKTLQSEQQRQRIYPERYFLSWLKGNRIFNFSFSIFN